MNRLQLLLALLLLSTSIYAQQLSLFTQYRENLTILNPAAVTTDYLAFEQNVSFAAAYRSQWTEFSANPTTATLRGDFLYAETDAFNMTTGGYVINDQTGPTGFTGIYGRFGGVITDDPYFGGISIGISGGAVQYRINTNDLRLRDREETLTFDNQKQWYPDVGVGLFVYKRLEGGKLDGDLFYGGVSVPQVMGLDLSFSDVQGDFSVQRVQHAYANAGFFKFLRNEGFLEPSVWVKYAPNAPLSVDINLRYQMANNFWIGAGGSIAGAAHLETGVLLGGDYTNLKIGYGFDYNFATFGPSTGTTHEVHVVYSFDY